MSVGNTVFSLGRIYSYILLKRTSIVDGRSCVGYAVSHVVSKGLDDGRLRVPIKTLVLEDGSVPAGPLTIFTFLCPDLGGLLTDRSDPLVSAFETHLHLQVERWWVSQSKTDSQRRVLTENR